MQRKLKRDGKGDKYLAELQRLDACEELSDVHLYEIRSLGMSQDLQQIIVRDKVQPGKYAPLGL